ncbi:hypothetical protein UGJNECP2_00179 [Escherichia phage UGJNEcP2]|nr:hypothetical protein UGJNECP1_00271 [Escherichia phage UGJNEcP1]CAH1616429.1 hypothetical protein UGJNECP2_00179 [Escherichia phage UGJNEcP2]
MTRSHYIEYFAGLIDNAHAQRATGAWTDVPHKGVVYSILRDFLTYVGQENHICKDTQNAYSHSLGTLLKWFKRSRLLSSTVARDNIKNFMKPSFIKSVTSKTDLVEFTIVNDVKKTHLADWLSTIPETKFADKFACEFNNQVNMLFKHSRKLFTGGDDRTNKVHVKDWVTAVFKPTGNGNASLSIDIQVPYCYSRNLGTMKAEEIKKHNKTIRSLSYKLRMMLRIMDVVEMYDETEDNGSMLYSSRIQIKLKNPNEYKPKPIKEPKAEKVDNLREEREYLKSRLKEVEAQIAEQTKSLKALNAKADGLRNAIEVL